MDQTTTEDIVPCVESYSEQMLNKDIISPQFYDDSKDIINIIHNPFDNFKSEHKRFKYFSEQHSYIEPKQIVIEER